MPYQLRHFMTGGIYHVLDRGINKQPVFLSIREFRRAVQAIDFYRFVDSLDGLAGYLQKSPEEQFQARQRQYQSGELVNILAYCLMDNHYHFLLQQLRDGGISHFISQFHNSFTRYANELHGRDGALFKRPFKAVRVEDEAQLLHLSRYIHLNPYSDYVVGSVEDLADYPWSSFSSYTSDKSSPLVMTEFIAQLFPNKDAYKQFVYDRADYQHNLSRIKHLVLD